MADLARRFCHLYKRQEILGQAVEILSFLVLALVYLCFLSFCLWITLCTLDTNIVAVLIVISVATEEKQQLKSYYSRNELIITKYS